MLELEGVQGDWASPQLSSEICFLVKIPEVKNDATLGKTMRYVHKGGSFAI